MKNHVKAICFFLTELLLLPLLCTAGGAALASEEPEAYDWSGRYLLSGNGEAIVDDFAGEPVAPSDPRNRVFYEIFPGSFSDSNGDGIGDIRGILNRLDYLNDGDPASGLSLGAEGLWLTPVFLSPSYHKYDVTDYYQIDPAFGTEQDLKALIDECHARGVLVILDLPLNHTGSENAWFLAFVRAHQTGDTSDPYYNWYTWYREGEPKPSAGTFRPIPGTNEYYECNFSADMPELNFDEPAVYGAMLDVARYWLTLGADGFRFDAAKYVYFNDHAKNAGFFARFIGDLKAAHPDVYTVLEVWDSDSVVYQYTGVSSCFNFTLYGAEGLYASTARHGNVNMLTSYVQKQLAKFSAQGGAAVFTPFLANHDTDRAAGFLTVASGQMRMAANLYLLSPGAPFIYYGEEIGMKGSRGASGTDANRRLGMLWGDGDTVLDPEGATYEKKKQTNGTVASLLGDGDSLFNYYKRLLLIRRTNPEIASGEYRALDLGGIKAGGFTSTLNGSTVAVIHNTSNARLVLDLSETDAAGFTVIRAAVGEGTATLENGILMLDGNTSVVLI